MLQEWHYRRPARHGDLQRHRLLLAEIVNDMATYAYVGCGALDNEPLLAAVDPGHLQRGRQRDVRQPQKRRLGTWFISARPNWGKVRKGLCPPLVEKLFLWLGGEWYIVLSMYVESIGEGEEGRGERM